MKEYRKVSCSLREGMPSAQTLRENIRTVNVFPSRSAANWFARDVRIPGVVSTALFERVVKAGNVSITLYVVVTRNVEAL